MEPHKISRPPFVGQLDLSPPWLNTDAVSHITQERSFMSFDSPPQLTSSSLCF
jgi:hypothetical protein